MIRFARPCNAALFVAILLATAGCSHLPRPHWPWHHQTAQGPEAVHELVITRADGSEAALPQYWKRNTLVVDLQSGGGEGSVIIKPREHTYWPVRIAFRVMPGQFGALEIRAQQRSVLPITASGAKPVDLELDPGVFIMKSPQIGVHWGPADQATDQSSGS